MKYSSSVIISGWLLTPAAFAAISLSIFKDVPSVPSVSNRGLEERQFEAPLLNQDQEYKAHIELGTPPQSIVVTLDTGSSEFWVFDINADNCQSKGSCSDGTFNSAKSTTVFVINEADFGIQYNDGFEVAGAYIEDNLSLGEGITLVNQVLGMAIKASPGLTSGILGIGYNTTDVHDVIGRYPNVPDELVAQGLIDAKAYSLHLDDVNANLGSIVFGGIDTEKFIGTLNSVPVVQVDGQYTSLQVLLSGIALTSAGNTIQLLQAPTLAVLDTGKAQSWLDPSFVEAMYISLGAIENDNFAWVDCNLRCTHYDDVLSFKFGSENGPVITQALADVILGPFGTPPGLVTPWENSCVLPFRPQAGSTFYLGATFLRAAYTVFDLQNNEIALAQSNFGATAENIQNIPKGLTGIPLLSGVENGVSKLPLVKTCSPASTSTQLPSSSTESSSSPTEPSTSTQVSTTSKPLITSTTSSIEVPNTSTEVATSSVESSTSTESSSTTPSSTNGGEGPTTTSSSLPSTHYSNSSMTTSSTITSTYTTTSIHTITSCPPAITDCPLGHVTTETIEVTTTYCPGEVSTPTLTPTYSASEIEVISQTIVYTISECPETVTSCPVGQVTTEIITYGTMYPVSETDESSPPCSTEEAAGEGAGGPSPPYPTTLFASEGESGGQTGTGGMAYPSSTGFPEFTGGVSRITVAGTFMMTALLVGLMLV